MLHIAEPELSDAPAINDNVLILAAGDCQKARAIARHVAELGVAFRQVDIIAEPDLSARLGVLFSDKIPHAPALVIRGIAWRNPRLSDIEKLLARDGLVPPRPLHYAHQQRIVWHMPHGDAFASYSMRLDGTYVFGHIEVPLAKRGTGLGARLAEELFDWIATNRVNALLTCSFLRRVAASKQKWSEQFLR